MAQYIGNGLTNSILESKRQTYTYIATSGQTVLSGVDTIGNEFVTQSHSQVLLYVNGLLIKPVGYTVNSTSVVMVDPLSSNDEVVIITEIASSLVSSYTRAETIYEITSRLDVLNLSSLTDVDTTSVAPEIGQTIIWNGTQYVPGDSFNLQMFNESLALKTTDDITEGAINLYYTDNRVAAHIAGINTDSLTEGTNNLYYTNDRVDQYITDYLYLNAYIDETAVNQLITNAISDLVDTAPATLDTLNELAAALGDDPNFASSIASTLSTKLNSDDFNSYADTWLGNKTTNNVIEGTANLYYTDARARNSIVAIGDLSYDSVNGVISFSESVNSVNGEIGDVVLDTDDITEGTTNLYYTEDRAYTSFTANLGTINTDNISEGAAHLYYTDARATANFTLNLSNSTTDDLAEGANLYFTNARVGNYLTANNYITSAYISTIDTDAIEEGSLNLYYTDSRVGNYLDANSYTTQTTVDATIAATTTDIINEGDVNLYYTDTRVGNYLLANSYVTETNVNQLIDAIDTDAIEEGLTNLYYTDTRVGNYLTANSYTTETDVTLLIDAIDTDAIEEGLTNLYYTDLRVGNYLNANNYATVSDLSLLLQDIHSDDIVEGSTNLYYTDFRVASYLTANSYVTETNVIALIDAIDTDAIEEGSTNLYYTDLRVGNYLTANSYVTETDVTLLIDAIDTDAIEEGSTNLYYTDIRVGNYLNANSYMTETNVISLIDAIDTDAIEEGATNLYYTDARVQTYLTNNDYITNTYITGGTGVTVNNGIVAIGQDVSTTANVTFADINASGDIVIDGNLTVSGTTTTINSTNLAIEDNMIYLNDGSVVANPDLGISGNYNDGTYSHAGIFRDATDGIWKFYDSYIPEPDVSPYIDTTHASFNLAPIQAGEFIGPLTGNVIGNVTGTVSDISNHDTDQLSEGPTNRYYTDARVGAYISTIDTGSLAEGSNLYYTDARVGTYIASIDSDDITEGTTNLYYTDARVGTYIGTIDTGSLAEGSNLYYTDARVGSYLTTVDTDSIAEGTTNLYYTDTRANAAIDLRVTKTFVDALGIDATTLDGENSTYYLDFSNMSNVPGYISSGLTVSLIDTNSQYSNSVTEVTGLRFDSDSGFDVTDLGNGNVKVAMNSTFKYWQVDGVDGLTAVGLDTVNFIAGNNISITADALSTPQSLTIESTLTSTDGLIEGSTNLYYTDSRVGAYIATINTDSIDEGSSNLYYNDAKVASYISTINTDSIAEGSTNLYYTDTRANAAIDARVDKTYIDALAIDAGTLDGIDSTGFATSAQGTLADSAVQPGDLATVATSGSYSDLINTPAIPADLTDLGITDGTANQILTTDGAGNFTFEDGPTAQSLSIINREYIANGSTNIYTISSGLTVDSIIVTENGIVQTPTTDYTVSGTTLTLIETPVSGVVIQIREFAGALTPAAQPTGVTTGKAIAMAIVFGG